MPSSTFEYWSGSAWTNESQVFRFSVKDVLGYPMFAEVEIANPLGNREDVYSDYQRVRIFLEASSTRRLFYGTITDIKPQWNGTYGQTLVITARDNLQELLKRTIDTNYTGHTRRSALIASIVADYSTTPAASGTANIDTSDAAKFEPSTVVEAAGVLVTNFSGAGYKALRAIQDIAHEDPWVASPNNTGFGWDFYLDNDFSGNNPIPDMHYFQRGSRPSGGADANGLTVELNGTAGNQDREMWPDYSFPVSSAELVTTVRVEYVDSAGMPASLSVILINISSVVGTFTVTDPDDITTLITWNAGANSASVQYVGSTFLTISGLTGTIDSSDAIAQASSSATANVDRVARESVEKEVEVVIRGYDIENLNEARQRAAQILWHNDDTVQRGVFKILNWPYFTILGTTTLVRAGHVIRVKCNPSASLNIDEDMLVTEIHFEEGPGVYQSEIHVVSTSRGTSVAPHIISTHDENIDVSMWQSMGSVGSFTLGIQPFVHDGTFTSIAGTPSGDGTSHDTLQWTNPLNISFADGTVHTVTDASPTLALTSATGTWYIYFDVDDATQLFATQTYSDAVAGDRGLLCIAIHSTDDEQEVGIIGFSGRGQNVNADVVAANAIFTDALQANAITAEKLEATLVLSTTVVAGTASPGARVELSSGGIIVHSDAVSARFQFAQSTYQNILFQYGNASGVGFFDVSPSGAGTAATLFQTSNFDLFAVNNLRLDNDLMLAGLSETHQIDVEGLTAPVLRPSTTDLLDLGDSTHIFAEVWTDDSYLANLRPRTGSTVNLYADIVPSADVTWDLGTNLISFANAYIENVFTPNLLPESDTITVWGVLVPDTADTWDLGSTALEWQDIYAMTLNLGATQEARLLVATGDLALQVKNGAGTLTSLVILRDGATPEVDFNARIDLQATYALFGLQVRTADPALADMQVGEIVLGDVGNTDTDGRIWIKANSGEIFEFVSTQRIVA